MPMGRGISASEASPSPYRPKSRFFEPLKDILSSERGMAEKWSAGRGGEEGKLRRVHISSLHLICLPHSALILSPLLSSRSKHESAPLRAPAPFPSDSDVSSPSSLLSHLRLRFVFPDNILPGHRPTEGRASEGRRWQPASTVHAMPPSSLSRSPAFFIE